MTKVGIEKSHIPTSHGERVGARTSGGSGASGFIRALKVEQSRDGATRSTVIAQTSAAEPEGNGTTGHGGELPTYETTRVLSLGDIASEFRLESTRMNELLGTADKHRLPTIAVMDLPQDSGKMQQIGKTIFVDQSSYNEWKAGSDQNGFEKSLHEMVVRSLTSVQ